MNASLSPIVGRDGHTHAPNHPAPALSCRRVGTKPHSDARRYPSAEEIKKLLHYDPGTGVFTWKARGESSSARPWANKIWNKRFAGKPAGRLVRGYVVIAIDSRPHQAHRLAWIYVYGVEPVDEIDHLSHDRTDNRIENLRVVTRDQNQRNKGLFKTNTSGATGVRFDKSRGKWVALISIDSKRINLGRFLNKEDAVAARQAAETHHGFHANHGKVVL